MDSRTLALIAGVAGIAALVYAVRGDSVFESEFSAIPLDEDSGGFDVGQIVVDPTIDNQSVVNDDYLDEGLVSMDNASATPEQRLAAFLYVIKASEHRFPDDVNNDACYNLFYSRIPFSNLSDHPVITKELRGVRLPDSMCANAGFPPGCVSTAAGAYQIIKPTWERARRSGTWGSRLPDFSKASQDEAARRILQMAGALDFVLAGDFETAIEKASPQWASLPKSTARQNPKSWRFVAARYDEGLGLLA